MFAPTASLEPAGHRVDDRAYLRRVTSPAVATKQRRTNPKPALRYPTAPQRPTISGLTPTDLAPGRTVSIGDFIVEQIKAGVDPINAAGVAGVTPDEFRAWVREGSLVISRLNAGGDWLRDFTPEQQDSAWFAQNVVMGRSAHISRLTLIAEQAARGGLTKTRTKRLLDPNTGNVIEEEVVTETTLPDPTMVRWKLEKLEPQVYGQKATLNLTVTDLTDTEDVEDIVTKRMLEVARSLEADYPGAIETTGKG